MNISLGFSPCPNDTYIFAALVNGWINTRGLRFSVHMEDVETLNEWAGDDFLDVTKMSFHRFLAPGQSYTLMSSGAALGNGCGPLVIAREKLPPESLSTIKVGLPGLWTTAHLLFRLFFPQTTQKQFFPFHEIEDLVLHEYIDAGVIIHENRFTYLKKGLKKVIDLGEEWETRTGLPIPLGGIFASHRLPPEIVATIDGLLKESIIFARHHPETVMAYVRQHAQSMEDEVMKSHIDLYVNDYSLDLGEIGLKSISRLKNFFLEATRADS